MTDTPPEPTILYRDKQLAVLAKPAQLATLADRSGAPCLWDRLPALLGCKPYLVHRLDKGTSGVLVVALDARTQSALTRAFQQRAVSKYYLAWVSGRVDCTGTARIDLPLRPGRKSRYRVAGPRESITRDAHGWMLQPPGTDGHPSQTRLRVLLQTNERTLLLLAPLTGRTHQLRVHLAWIGHPIMGDHLYGKPGATAQQADRLQLHCHRLVIPGWGTFATPPGDDWLSSAGEPTGEVAAKD